MGDKFDFHATLSAVGQAVVAVICHILFDFALVGLGVAAVLATCAFVLGRRKHHFERPFYAVSRRISLSCLGLSVPGLACLALTGHLPESGVYVNFSLGFLVLWSMVTIYLCAEEMNYEWFIRGESPKELVLEESEPETVEASKIAGDSSESSEAEGNEQQSDSVRETLANR